MIRRDRRFAAVAAAVLGAALALPLAAAPADPCGGEALPTLALERVNRLRAEGASCGGVSAPPAPALGWSDAATAAARAHAQDMARQGRMAHAGSDGQDGGERLRQAGVAWRRWAENLAAGARSIDEVMRLWAASPVHCENLMEPQLAQVGMACVLSRNGRPFWAMTLMTPK
ncbi:CAP domain-containing protein [Ideonella sp. A 288]|uniref:CAP domain-containing protein n=1 Tax=Ideonella sp. A 288 TaxID=1962181 RepID=UPI000B4A5756|nr:CAP domain-containing protein [Ideonella sp. A 288]